MNKIEMNIYDRVRLNRELLGADIDETDLKEKMIALAYEKENLEMLVNRMRIQKNYLDISEMECFEDYEVITGSYYDNNGDSFADEEEYKNYLKENCIDEDEVEDFDQLDFEYDEIYWDIAINFDEYDNKVNIENAIKCGLGVLEVLSSGEQYLFLRGCGMDMSFQHLQYQALTFGAISDEYVSKLGWLKANVSREEYDEVLKKLGVDLKRLRKAS